MNKFKQFKPMIVKILNGILVCFTIFLLIFTIMSVNVNKDYGKGFLGYKFFIVMSDSMKPEFQAGDIVIVKNVDKDNLKVGDVITFYVGDGTVLTHQIHEKLDGKFITKGINVDQEDPMPVYPSKVIGEYQLAIPKAGRLIASLKTQTGFITMILIPLLILMIMSGVQFIKQYKEYKREKNKETEMKKLLLDQEIEKNRRLYEELMQIKEQLSVRNNTSELS